MRDNTRSNDDPHRVARTVGHPVAIRVSFHIVDGIWLCPLPPNAVFNAADVLDSFVRILLWLFVNTLDLFGYIHVP